MWVGLVQFCGRTSSCNWISMVRAYCSGHFCKHSICHIQKNQDRFCGPGQNLYCLKYKRQPTGAFSGIRKWVLSFWDRSNLGTGGAYCSLANRSLKYWRSSGGVFKISMAWSMETFSVDIRFLMLSALPTAFPSAKPSALPSLMPAS